MFQVIIDSFIFSNRVTRVRTGMVRLSTGLVVDLLQVNRDAIQTDRQDEDKRTIYGSESFDYYVKVGLGDPIIDGKFKVLPTQKPTIMPYPPNEENDRQKKHQP